LTGDRPLAKDAAFVAVDWGTSSFRLWVFDGGGNVMAERRSDEGMMHAAQAGFGPILETHLRAAGASDDLPVIICGMAGARQGWLEAPYVDAPAALETLADRAVPVPGIARPVRILPGVAQRKPGRFDVMRGEETQLLGLLAVNPAIALACLPGTHSKWVDVEDGRVAGFSTFMTGELFALLCEHSILRHGMAEPSTPIATGEAFLAGVESSLEYPARATTHLFELRAATLLAGLSPEDMRARLSGMLIGLEIAGAVTLHDLYQPVMLAASGPLAELYGAALRHAGVVTIAADAGEAVRRGLLEAARRLLPTMGAGA
jgi:2-dehydro-3-deoxygalactonokinase